MCDSLVVVAPGQPVWLGKNSDRHPDEVQLLERHPAADHPAGTSLRVTHLELPQARATLDVLLSRPRGMWGCEMGVNARGLAVANEAVFARGRLPDRGLTGMDLQRLALERTATADDALELIVDLLARVGQGGDCGGLRYSSSFILADPGGAWILETAGDLWAAQRVHGARTISNALTIDREFDRLHPDALAVARRRRACTGAADFGFASCFASPLYRHLTGGDPRRACTRDLLADALRRGIPGPAAIAAILADHGGLAPADGWRMLMPCAHASWLPTRAHGQTTASLVARLDRHGPRVWATGTSSPCLGVFKPARLDHDLPDAEDLWRAHERLHRLTLLDYPARRAAFAPARADLQARAWQVDADDPAAVAAVWREHRRSLATWTEAAAAVGRPGARPFHRWWARKAADPRSAR